MENKSNIKFNTVLRSLRKQNGMTLEELGEIMGKTKSAISRWESGENSPKVEDIEKLSSLFGINIENLIFGNNETGDSLLSIYNQLNKENQYKVNTFAQDVLKEQDDNIIDLREYDDVEVKSIVESDNGFIELEPKFKEIISFKGYIPIGYDVAFRISGTRMKPFFKDDEIIFVKRDKVIRSGQLGIVILDGLAYLKKIYVNDDKLQLVSLSEKIEEIVVNKSDITVFGKVIL